MNHAELEIIKEFKNTFKQNLITIKNFMDVIIPISEEDSKIINVGYDMIEQLIDDIGNCNMNELSATFDLDKIVDSWEAIQPLLKEIDDHRSTSSIIEEIISTYEKTY